VSCVQGKARSNFAAGKQWRQQRRGGVADTNTETRGRLGGVCGSHCGQHPRRANTQAPSRRARTVLRLAGLSLSVNVYVCVVCLVSVSVSVPLPVPGNVPAPVFAFPACRRWVKQACINKFYR